MWPYSKRKMRDRIRADYLARTGRQTFDPDQFLEWLRGQPDHEAWPWFFGEQTEA